MTNHLNVVAIPRESAETILTSILLPSGATAGEARTCIRARALLDWRFSLSTANYLYDIRPHKSDFAVYAAMQSALSACAVFFGAIAGGWIASAAPAVVQAVPFMDSLLSPLYLVFIASCVLRIAVTAWFIPRAVEPHGRRRPKFLQIIFRISRFNAISGVSLDWLSVTRRKQKGVRSEADELDEDEHP